MNGWGSGPNVCSNYKETTKKQTYYYYSKQYTIELILNILNMGLKKVGRFMYSF